MSLASVDFIKCIRPGARPRCIDFDSGFKIQSKEDLFSMIAECFEDAHFHVGLSKIEGYCKRKLLWTILKKDFPQHFDVSFVACSEEEYEEECVEDDLVITFDGEVIWALSQGDNIKYFFDEPCS